MESYQDLISAITVTLGASWASGINLYATLLVCGLAGATGQFDLPPDLAILSNPMVILAAGIMFVVEFVTDKIPGIDSAWDAIHTFILLKTGCRACPTSGYQELMFYLFSSDQVHLNPFDFPGPVMHVFVIAML